MNKHLDNLINIIESDVSKHLDCSSVLECVQIWQHITVLEKILWKEISYIETERIRFYYGNHFIKLMKWYNKPLKYHSEKLEVIDRELNHLTVERLKTKGVI